MITFNELGLSNDILKALGDLGFETPTEIQAKAIPQMLENHKDVIGLAQTGTGKTGAFGLPLVDLVDVGSRDIQGLILSPTRELCRQITEELYKFSKFKKEMHVVPVYGGAAISVQIKALKKPTHIVVATPGRLNDLLKRKAIKLHNLKYLVLDEADEMLNMGFKEEIDTILEYTHEDKLTWLFSATMPKEILHIVESYMHEPIEVKVTTGKETNKNIEHCYAIMRPKNKLAALKRFLDHEKELRGVVFCRTKRDTQDVAEALLKQNYKADALHGDLSQHQRDRVMGRFRENALRVLIATDVAARGIDVNDLTHVFHYSMPDNDEYYTHRSGRTARGGKKGKSIAFITSRELGRIRRMEKQLNMTFKQEMIPSKEDISLVRVEKLLTSIGEVDISTGVNSELFTIGKNTFGEMTKEQLIAKLIQFELNQIGNAGDEDLNDTSKPKRDKDGGRRDGGRGRRGGGGDRGRRGKRFGSGSSRKRKDSRSEGSRDGKPKSRSNNKKKYFGK